MSIHSPIPNERPLNPDLLLAELDALIAGGSPAALETAPARTPKVPKILVVDDNNDYRDAVRSLLEQHGYEVVEAGNGAEGLRWAVAERPDIVLLDFNMPLMNGYELIQELRTDSDLRKVPIIMFTGAANRSSLEGIELHVHAFLYKPVSNFRLIEAIRGALGGASGNPLVSPHEIVLDPRPEKPVAPAAPLADLSSLDKRELDSLEGLQAAGEILIETEKEREEDRASSVEMLTQNSPLVNYVNRILMNAVQLGASDIHIEPQEKEIGVRVRLNGTLNPLCTLPVALSARLSARVKIISNLVITERRRPQDGQFRITLQGRKIDFRVSILPGIHGEKIVMRILGGGKVQTALSEIGFNTRDLECIGKAVQSQNGLILVTGPTGSGKTTTLYTLIGILNKPGVNIMTAEDPVEYQLPGITQVHIKPAIGLTFESVLRSFLRQDPDIMLIGEIRDLETAEIAVKASITGHLVLSTLHTNSAPATIARLTQMGIKPFLAADSVKIVIAQRLVKLLCPHCRLQVPLSEAEKRMLSEEELAAMRGIYRGVGCSACRQTGYSGRRPIFEVMPVRTPEMRQLIQSSNGVSSMTELAAKEGMSSLRQSALGLAASGATSLSEALKIVLSE